MFLSYESRLSSKAATPSQATWYTQGLHGTYYVLSVYWMNELGVLIKSQYKWQEIYTENKFFKKSPSWLTTIVLKQKSDIFQKIYHYSGVFYLLSTHQQILGLQIFSYIF